MHLRPTHADPTCLVSTVKRVTLNGTSFPYDVIYPSAGAAVLRVTKMNLKQGPESEGVLREEGGEGNEGSTSLRERDTPAFRVALQALGG